MDAHLKEIKTRSSTFIVVILARFGSKILKLYFKIIIKRYYDRGEYSKGALSLIKRIDKDIKSSFLKVKLKYKRGGTLLYDQSYQAIL